MAKLVVSAISLDLVFLGVWIHFEKALLRFISDEHG